MVPVLEEIPLSVLMAQSGLDRRTLQRLRNGHSRPHRRNEEVLVCIAGSHAREQPRKRGIDARG